MCAFSVTSVPLCRSHTEMYLNCLHSQYAIVNHISDIDTANMTLGKRGKTIVHRFYYKHDQLAERAALQPHFDHTASRSGNLLYDQNNCEKDADPTLLQSGLNIICRSSVRTSVLCFVFVNLSKRTFDKCRCASENSRKPHPEHCA